MYRMNNNVMTMLLTALMFVLSIGSIPSRTWAQSIDEKLLKAVEDGDICLVNKYIAEDNADPFYPTTLYLPNSFEVAASKCYVHILMALIQYARRHDMELRRTYFGHTDIVYNALACGAPTQRRLETIMALWRVLDPENPVSLGSPINVVAGSAPLYSAVQVFHHAHGCDHWCASLQVVKYLLTVGADVNNAESWAASASGVCRKNTALHAAASFGDAMGLDLVLELLRNGADPTLPNECETSGRGTYSETPQQIAQRLGSALNEGIRRAMADVVGGGFDYNNDYGHRLHCDRETRMYTS